MTIDGNLIRVNVNDEELDCQLDSSLTQTANMTTNSACKGETRAESNTVGSTSWSIDVSGKADTVTASANGVFELSDKLQTGSLVEVAFLSTGTLASGESAFMFEGDAHVTNLVINAPADGEVTWDATFTGSGDLVKTRTPVT